MAGEQKKPNLIQELLDKLGALVTAAFGLVAALAWNEAIQSFFREFFGPQDTLMPKVIYAVIVTVIAVVFTFFIARAVMHAKERSSNLGL